MEARLTSSAMHEHSTTRAQSVGITTSAMALLYLRRSLLQSHTMVRP